MQINILQRGEEDKAKGLAVVIDVFRAFTTSCYVYNNGVKKIITVGEIELAYDLKQKNKDYILMGERNGYIQPGFDYGNSPSVIKDVDFTGKTVILTTSRGTQGIMSVLNIADEIITGSFVNVDAIINYIKYRNPEYVSLVCTGVANELSPDEDTACAVYIKNGLLNKVNDFSKIKQHLKEQGYTDMFFDPDIKSHPEGDLQSCLDLNKFNFVLRVKKENDLLCLEKVI